MMAARCETRRHFHFKKGYLGLLYSGKYTFLLKNAQNIRVFAQYFSIIRKFCVSLHHKISLT